MEWGTPKDISTRHVGGSLESPMESAHATLRKSLEESNRRWLETGETCEIAGYVNGKIVEVPFDQQMRLWKNLGLPTRRNTQ